ncbi:MAG: sialidase family protein [Candidatus Cyclobacteriaceae bacterium M3_2C_046]
MKQYFLQGVVFAGFLCGFLSCQSTGGEETSATTFQSSVIFPLQSDHVHGPTMVDLPNGDLLAAWFQGSGERWADDVRIMGSRLTNGDTAWSQPFLMADVPGFPDINPMMFMDQEQRLWLMWYPVVANQWETSIPMYRISQDYLSAGPPEWDWQDILLAKPGDKTERGIQPGDRFVEATQQQLKEYEYYLKQELLPQFTAAEQSQFLQWWDGYKQKTDSLVQGRNMVRSGRIRQDGQEVSARLGYPLSRRIGWQTKNKPLLVGDRIIVPLYSDGLDCSLFALTDDLGKTWQFSNPVIGGIGIQPAIAVAGDGTLAAFLRDNGPPPQRIQQTVSYDTGATWTIARDIELPNPGAGFDITNLASGEWLLVYNDQEEGRYNLTAALSVDAGKSWPWKRSIEHDPRGELATASHYPAVIQSEDQMIHVVYSFHHNDRKGAPHKTIKYVRFSPEWIKTAQAPE